MTKTKITTIIFDMGNVLVQFRWRQLYREMGLTGERFERMADATVRNPVWNEIDKGNYTDEQMLEAFIANAPELEEEIRDLMYNRFRGYLRKFDYTDDWLDGLKSKGYRIYILSNFSRKGIEDVPEELDYMSKADGAVISYREGLIKPDPAIYRLLFERYGIDPAEAVFIDDTAENIKTAKRLGLNTVLFTGKEAADGELAKLGVIY